MKSFSKLHSDFWINYDNSKVITQGADAQLMALYLQGNSHRNIFGAYYLPLPYIASDLKLPVKKVHTALEKLCKINYCKYDDKTQYVWVCDLLHEQIGKSIKSTDNCSKFIQETWQSLPLKLEFLEDIYNKYGESFHLDISLLEDSKSYKEKEALQISSETSLTNIQNLVEEKLPTKELEHASTDPEVSLEPTMSSTTASENNTTDLQLTTPKTPSQNSSEEENIDDKKEGVVAHTYIEPESSFESPYTESETFTQNSSSIDTGIDTGIDADINTEANSFNDIDINYFAEQSDFFNDIDANYFTELDSIDETDEINFTSTTSKNLLTHSNGISTPFEAPSNPLQSPLKGASDTLRSNIEDRSKNIEEITKNIEYKNKKEDLKKENININHAPNSYIALQARPDACDKPSGKIYSFFEKQEASGSEKQEAPERIPLELSSNDFQITLENPNHKPNQAVYLKTNVDARITAVFDHWKRVMNHPYASLNLNQTKLIRITLRNYSVALQCEAITGCSYTPFNIGDNDRGQRYDGLHIILAEKNIDRFISNCHSPPKPRTKAHQIQDANFYEARKFVIETMENNHA